jgi:hypothetical protein
MKLMGHEARKVFERYNIRGRAEPGLLLVIRTMGDVTMLQGVKGPVAALETRLKGTRYSLRGR